MKLTAVPRFARRLKAKHFANMFQKIELLEYVAQMGEGHYDFRRPGKPLFFFNEREAQVFYQDLPQLKKTIISEADEICAHNFDFLGSGKNNIDLQPGKIGWHKDFKSGTSWDPEIIYTDIETVKGNGSDIKIPWELSRFQHLPTLGKAYWLTKNEKYAIEFINEINDWIETNPALYGVNWACTMDVAIRAVNLIWGYYYFRFSPEVNTEFLKKFLQSLYIHGTFINANLERSSRILNFAGSIIRRQPDLTILKPGWHVPVNNHYLSDIVGLVYLGIIFPKFKRAKKWLEFSFQQLLKEMRAEVYADGVDYEGSISYHRLVTELFLSAALLCIKNNITFPAWYMRRLEDMIDFTMYYTKPDGMAPQIGDNDDGRLHILSNYGNWNRRDHRYLLSIGAVLFSRADFKLAAGEFHEDTFWLLGDDGIRQFDELSVENKPLQSKAFEQAGFYFMRKNDLYMAVDCINMNQKSPTDHKHNSRLSFELYAYDKSFIVDPGAYIYTADKEMRNLFRSTKYHNTVVVDGEEQNRFNEDALFNMKFDSMVRVNKWDTTEKLDILDAEHYGYRRLRQPVVHRRQIVFDKLNGYWVVKDILTGEGVHHFDLYFHFAPMNIEVDEKFPLVVKTKIEGVNLAIIPLETNGISLEILNGFISYQYGVKMEAPIAKYSRIGCVPVTFNNILYPYLDGVDIGQIIKKR